MTTKTDIENVLWSASDSFRGKIDSSRYKDYILSMLFVKYLSDVHKSKVQKLTENYKGNKVRIERALSYESFVLDEESTFDYLYANKNDSEIGQKINVALSHIEDKNSDKLKDVFRAIDFNSQVDFGAAKEKNAILKNLLDDFNGLDLRPEEIESNDIIGDAYEYMISKFASDAGKKGGEFFTPSEISELVSRLAEPVENDRIYDPTCGSGGLLLKAYKKVLNKKVAIYGQESNAQTRALCLMNMFLHGVEDANIWLGDTLASPKNIENDNLMKFQVVVANPPFSLDKWDSGFLPDSGLDEKGKPAKMSASLDPYKRFTLGVPPKSKGDYAFVLHMINSLDEENGRMAVVLPHGTLFRGSSEGKIRRSLLELNLVDAVIGLPPNLFFGTSIPACIMIFKKNKNNKDVLFIDASGEDCFEKGKNQNTLREEDIKRIVETYKERKEIEKFSHIATLEEIKENDFNLNIPRYVDTFEEEEPVNIQEVKQEIEKIDEELVEVRSKLQEYLKELGL
ncbi:type I restriction-modification system subunit M [Fusobacterium sp. IOR10]|uniref:type I restriction-modification system subunit M n=1 Tax=Fusobacterium sp. IOR10 TaxID=2665157 RepID=UPI0013D236F2|nr:type I restriction-modification system subunit M [Fusobacterium sp. IOR10]